MILREFELLELEEMIRKAVRDELQKIQTPPKEKEFIRRNEARELLGGISNPTIISYEKRGLIHPKRIGGTILYDKAEILQTSKGR